MLVLGRERWSTVVDDWAFLTLDERVVLWDQQQQVGLFALERVDQWFWRQVFLFGLCFLTRHSVTGLHLKGTGELKTYICVTTEEKKKPREKQGNDKLVKNCSIFYLEVIALDVYLCISLSNFNQCLK